MKKFDFLIGYDISSPKRLRKLAKLLDSEAIRIQFSLFLYPKQDKKSLKILIDKIVKIIDQSEDDVRVYRIDIARSIHLMSGVDLQYPKVYIGGV